MRRVRKNLQVPRQSQQTHAGPDWIQTSKRQTRYDLSPAFQSEHNKKLTNKDGKKVEYNSVGRLRVKKHFCEYCGKLSEEAEKLSVWVRTDCSLCRASRSRHSTWSIGRRTQERSCTIARSVARGSGSPPLTTTTLGCISGERAEQAVFERLVITRYCCTGRRGSKWTRTRTLSTTTGECQFFSNVQSPFYSTNFKIGSGDPNYLCRDLS